MANLTIVNLSTAFGVLTGAISLMNFTAYVTKDADTYESQLLRGTAGYIQNYEGETLKPALDYTQRTLEITRQFQPEKIGALEKEVSEISAQISETNSQIYKPILKNLAEEIKAASIKKERNPGYLVGGLFGALALALASFSGFLARKS